MDGTTASIDLQEFVRVADLVDEKSGMSTGFIGLQVHGIGKGTGPYEVRWRNIQIKDLAK